MRCGGDEYLIGQRYGQNIDQRLFAAAKRRDVIAKTGFRHREGSEPIDRVCIENVALLVELKPAFFFQGAADFLPEIRFIGSAVENDNDRKV